MEIQRLYNCFQQSSGVSIDTRTIVEGNMFFAIKGDNFNGNKYAKLALENGASYVVVDEKNLVENERYILVQDSLMALQQLSSYYRSTFQGKVIALTGSNGKTTTKELIISVLSSIYRVDGTVGNLNNHLGVPLTLLRSKPDCDFVIVEMGANHVGEIANLSEIAKPDYGLITNIGKAHLEGFGGQEGVIKGKSELYKYLIANNKTIFVNKDDHILTELVDDYAKVVTYSKTKFQIMLSDDFLTFKNTNNIIETNLIGEYQLNNIAAAWAMGEYCGVGLNQIEQAIKKYLPSNNRSQVLHHEGNTYLLDAYNANPSSMNASIDAFLQTSYSNKAIVLGDMLELGEYSHEEHQKLVDKLNKIQNIEVYYVGKIFKSVLPENSSNVFATVDELSIELSNKKYLNYHILLKGSRGLALEKLVQ